MANLPLQSVSLEETDEGARPNYTPALASLAVLYFMMGFITCLNDTLVPFFKKGFSLNYTQSSLVQFYFFLTYGIMSIPAGKIVERVGYKTGMVLGFSIAALGAVLFYPASALHQYALFLAALFVIAIGIVLLQVAANPYVTILGPAQTASARLTLIQGVGSMGTTVAPLFGAAFILAPLADASSDAVRYPYLGIAALLAAIALVVGRLRLPVLKAGSTTELAPEPTTNRVFSFRNLRFGVWGIFCYVGAEVAIGTFLTNYIADTLHTTEQEANQFVAFYWASMLVGRFLGAFLLKSIKASTMLTACALLAMVLVTVSILSTGYLAVWSMIAVGLCNSVMFAILFSLSVQGLGRLTDQASGWLATAITGGAMVPFCQGLLIDRFSWPVAFLLPLVCYAYILFYGLNGYKSVKN
ncbi:FHS family L-fucose permease-like MFS transporter [Larkinella arboricola]|uniref:FHS family L-fucose permease-like MFS transporter n=1 Tax=Larkinella arboricola TaxID=643671 RepID=A0A327X0L2_LARAB|nr:sugar MFS transporter [Larkinella arboricola]RAJ99895.1 FHS family L-fucose permease-like MFS transporter [Larkinella arboricola]